MLNYNTKDPTEHSELKEHKLKDFSWYILVAEFLLHHTGSEELLLHLQDRRLLSAQPLLLGVLHASKHAQSFSFIVTSGNVRTQDVLP